MRDTLTCNTSTRHAYTTSIIHTEVSTATRTWNFLVPYLALVSTAAHSKCHRRSIRSDALSLVVWGGPDWPPSTGGRELLAPFPLSHSDPLPCVELWSIAYSFFKYTTDTVACQGRRPLDPMLVKITINRATPARAKNATNGPQSGAVTHHQLHAIALVSFSVNRIRNRAVQKPICMWSLFKSFIVYKSSPCLSRGSKLGASHTSLVVVWSTFPTRTTELYLRLNLSTTTKTGKVQPIPSL